MKYQILNIVDDRTGCELDPILFAGDGFSEADAVKMGKDSLSDRLEIDLETVNRHYSVYVSVPKTVYTTSDPAKV